MMIDIKIGCIICGLAAITLPAQETIVLQQGRDGYTGCQDAHILINKPDWNTGAEEGLETTGNGGEIDAKHGLLRFDLSGLPTNKIDSAWVALYLVKRRTPQLGNKTLAIYSLKQAWGEGTGDDPGGYDGRPAIQGEVTWQHASIPDRRWAADGANHVPLDHTGQPEDQRTFSPTDPDGQWFAWELTDLVRFWLTHPDSNFGFLLREPVVSQQTGILNFASSEFNPDSLRPKLFIRFETSMTQTLAQNLRETHTNDAITVTWPYRGDADGDGHAEISLARAGDAYWGDRIAMSRSTDAYTHTFTGLKYGFYHLRGWMTDPDGVLGSAIQTLLNIELMPNSSKIGQLYTVIYDDNRVHVVLTFYHDGNNNNAARLSHKSAESIDWLDDGLLSRSSGKFETVLSELQGGCSYDLRVTLSDPDGIEGDSTCVTRLILPERTGPVRILSAGARQFHIQSGFYSILYDRARTGSRLWIQCATAPKTILCNAVVKGLPFQVLDQTNLDSVRLSESDQEIAAILHGHWQSVSYQVLIDCYKQQPGFFHWRCMLENAETIISSNDEVECTFFDRERRFEISAEVDPYFQQAPYCTGIAYGYESEAVQGTIFYLQDFSTLNDYFSTQRVGPEKCVHISSTGIGFARPSANKPLRPEKTIICDAYLYLVPGRPASESAMAANFNVALSAVYARMNKPAIQTVDWPRIAEKLVQDLNDDRCLVTVQGEKLLRSYVSVPRTQTAEAITQLDVLIGLRQYEKIVGNVTDLDERLSQNLYQYYSLEHRTMVNDAPSGGVQEGDSWYAVHIHLGLSRLAKAGDANARTLLHLSLPKLIAFAKNVHYKFPMFFRYGDNSAISGSEPDVTGGYLYLMLDALELTGDVVYLDEAKTAAEHLGGYGFEYTYEAHMTAATCAALARLWRITGERRYLEMSYLPFANIMALTWLWECDYGYAKEYPTFFGLAPMAGAAVITMMEQHHSWTYLREYRTLASDDLPESVCTLLDGFIAYTPIVLKYSLPPFLPSAAFFAGPTIYNSYNVASFYIPLEDLREGWQKSGWLGQQIYGAGGPLIFAAAALTTKVDGKTDRIKQIACEFGLEQNHPNPFNRGTTLRYRLPATQKTPVQLQIFDILGRRVVSLVDGVQSGGEKKVYWNGCDDKGEAVGAGIYFIVLSVPERIAVKKMLLVR